MLHRLAGLIGLKMTDQVPSGNFTQLRNLGSAFLHPAFSDIGYPGRHSGSDRLGRERL